MFQQDISTTVPPSMHGSRHANPEPHPKVWKDRDPGEIQGGARSIARSKGEARATSFFGLILPAAAVVVAVASYRAHFA